ncbi:hypothetical protein KAF25_008625 [Fusarium avenaceum]|uniref:BZIP domain-containing protein n=1 Tax=Fusarium avenaceum TaxID=40199 RepID=A0A9P7KZU0_9HYPO|nr:hypothetical protein KAF25_008625 [Fusarium avenaceum]
MATFQAQALCIQLTAMPQLAEALSARDDWTGTKDAAARRRAQTRLNMRAYRKRKAQERKTEALSDAMIKSEPLVECWDIKQESMSTISASRATQLYSKRTPVLPIRSKRTQFNFVFPLSPDHLITLLQYNALRALAVNRTLISGILTTPLDCDVETVHVVPYPTNPDSVPSALLPTILQQTIPHGDWVDMFPCAEGRDNLIRAAGTFDEDELWDDCIGGLYEGYPDDEMERRGMIAWSPPWDISGWEMSEGFVRKWGWLFKGLPGPLEATNRWRIGRGEEPFEDADLPSGTVFVGSSVKPNRCHYDDPSKSTSLSDEVSPTDNDDGHVASPSALLPTAFLFLPEHRRSVKKHLPENENDKAPNPPERTSSKREVLWESKYKNESQETLEAALTEAAKQILYTNKKLKRQVSMDVTYWTGYLDLVKMKQDQIAITTELKAVQSNTNSSLPWQSSTSSRVTKKFEDEFNS